MFLFRHANPTKPWKIKNPIYPPIIRVLLLKVLIAIIEINAPREFPNPNIKVPNLGVKEEDEPDASINI